MASQSITNKLVANIKQATDVSRNFFRGTNVVCIDTSNRRIGIDTKTPTWSIDISGVEPYNGVKCHNLDISGRADISYALIKDLRAPIISGDNVNISFIYVNELSGNLIDISEVIFNSISGDFIYSNNTITGNFIECFSGVILNDLSINGKLKVTEFKFSNIVDFSKITIDTSLTTLSASTSKFEGKVEFLNNNVPVKYKELSGNHINTFSISCDNLQVKQQADFSLINVSAEASFNTIDVSGLASFSTISAETITRNGDNLDTIISQRASSDLNFTKEISLNRIYAKKIYIDNTIDNPLNTNYISFNQVKPTYSNIDKLIINSELDLSYNSATSLRLPYNSVDIGARKLGHIYYSKDAAGVIDGIQIIKSNAQDTNLSLNTVTLKQSSTTSYMLKLIENDPTFANYGNFKCVPMTTHPNSGSQFDTPINSNKPQFVNIDNIITDIIEINANITLSLNNDVNGKDVDAINYDFYIFGLNTDTGHSNIDDKRLVSNKNTILVFDNSYNYSSTSLHYIGEKKEIIDNTLGIKYIVFGISYENVPGKTLSLKLENFNASIKSV